jgi:hypothetical protein
MNPHQFPNANGTTAFAATWHSQFHARIRFLGGLPREPTPKHPQTAAPDQKPACSTDYLNPPETNKIAHLNSLFTTYRQTSSHLSYLFTYTNQQPLPLLTRILTVLTLK